MRGGKRKEKRTEYKKNTTVAKRIVKEKQAAESTEKVTNNTRMQKRD